MSPGTGGRRGPRALLLGMGWFPAEIGGLNRYVRSLYEALSGEGTAPRVLGLGPAAGAPADFIVAGKKASGVLGRVLSYARAAGRAAPEADVVDAFFALYSFLPVVARRIKGRPLVVHFLGPWARESRAAGEHSGLRFWVKQRMESAVYRRAQRLIVLSEEFKRILVGDYSVPPWRVDVIHPGVDLERFTPGGREAARVRLGVPEGQFRILSVRRLVPRMGLETLLRAWAELDGGQDLSLVIAGGGPEKPALENLAKDLNLKSVSFPGIIPDPDLPDWYRAADLVVLPSLELEGFSLVALEAMACGTPVLATNIGGLGEVLPDLNGSLVYPAGDVNALANRINRFLADRGDFPSRASCAHFAARFGWDNVARSTIAVYEAAMQPAPGDRIRVVYLDHIARPSGAELALSRLLPALKDVDAHVILGERGPLVQRLRDSGISVEVMPMRARARDLHKEDVRPLHLPLAAAADAMAYSWRLSRKLRHLRPDIVHANTLKSVLYGSLAGRLARIPVLWHARDRVENDYLPTAAVRMVRLAARILPTRVIANSEATLASLHLVRPGIVVGSTVVPDPTLSVERADNHAPSAFTAGILGRLAPWKGQDVFLRAFAEAFPNGDARAKVMGAALFGEDAYAQRLVTVAQELGIADRVEFTGFVDQPYRELRDLDVLVHCSTVAEPFGQVIVEGMAAGLPVVATEGGGPAEVIEPGVSGILVPPNDIRALADALRLLEQDEALRGRLGSAGREAAAAYSPEKVAERMTDIYRSMLR